MFDTARQVHVIEAKAGRILGEADETLPDGLPVQQVARLVDLGVGTLVCGAISWPLRAMVAAAGIEVMPFVAGPVSQVVPAWLAGTPGLRAFVMPGCGGQCRRAPGTPGHGRGWGSGPRAGGVAGTCVCPACGHREPHERGVSCAERPCPVCGARMIREW